MHGGIDTLLGGRVTLRQPPDGYRVAIDTVMLAAAVSAKPDDSVLELGSGVGGATLCLAWRVPGCRIVGVEIEPALVALARENAAANRVDARVSFIEGDVCEALERIPDLRAGHFDHVIANPPYLEVHRVREPAHQNRTTAFVEREACGLEHWIRRMVALTRRKGRITLIQRADRLAHLLAALDRNIGEIVVFPLWPKAGAPAKRVLVSGRVGARGALAVAPGMTLHAADGSYTQAANAILRHGQGLVL